MLHPGAIDFTILPQGNELTVEIGISSSFRFPDSSMPAAGAECGCRETKGFSHDVIIRKRLRRVNKGVRLRGIS